MLKISGAMIVRDAAATVRAAIESLRPTCDEVVVLDTGSTDGTLEILRDLARAWAEDAGGTKLDVWEWAWRDDFSAARNEVQSHCSGEWIVVLDADEVLTAGDLRERLLTAEERIDAAVAPVPMDPPSPQPVARCSYGGPHDGQDSHQLRGRPATPPRSLGPDAVALL